VSNFGSWFRNSFQKKAFIPEERIRQVVESILENESLTANLDDDAARVLLAWGTARARSIAQSTAGLDDETAEGAIYPRMRALRRMLRAINRWIPNRLNMSMDDNRAVLAGILEQASKVYGADFVPPDEGQVQVFLDEDLATAPVRAIDGLRKIIEWKGWND